VLVFFKKIDSVRFKISFEKILKLKKSMNYGMSAHTTRGKLHVYIVSAPVPHAAVPK